MPPPTICPGQPLTIPSRSTRLSLSDLGFGSRQPARDSCRTTRSLSTGPAHLSRERTSPSKRVRRNAAASLWRMDRSLCSNTWCLRQEVFVQEPLAFPVTKDDILSFVEGVRKTINDANDIVLAGEECVAIGTLLFIINALVTDRKPITRQ